jgi:hypothetical protein
MTDPLLWQYDDPRLAYTPCREDGLDRNLRFLPRVDYKSGVGHQGLVIPCSYPQCEPCRTRRPLP